MTSPEMVLAERIRDEIVDLDRSVARASAAWERGKISADQDYYLDAVALNRLAGPGGASAGRAWASQQPGP